MLKQMPQLSLIIMLLILHCFSSFRSLEIDAGELHHNIMISFFLIVPLNKHYIFRGQPPDDLLRGAKNTVRFFKPLGNINPGIRSREGPGTSYRMLSEEEVEGVSFLIFHNKHLFLLYSRLS
jgi:hypothetical protein